MEKILLGFLTGISLILAVGPQNLFVIEQGLKRNYIFVVCLICSLSDVFFIFFGMFLFSVFNSLNDQVNIILNILLLLFIFIFIWNKLKTLTHTHNIKESLKKEKLLIVVLKTLAFTYLNPHVYSDTILILGGFSKSFIFVEKVNFGLGASLASFIYFFSLGYGSSYFSVRLNNRVAWFYINLFIILFMLTLCIFVSYEILT